VCSCGGHGTFKEVGECEVSNRKQEEDKMFVIGRCATARVAFSPHFQKVENKMEKKEC